MPRGAHPLLLIPEHGWTLPASGGLLLPRKSRVHMNHGSRKRDRENLEKTHQGSRNSISILAAPMETPAPALSTQSQPQRCDHPHSGNTGKWVLPADRMLPWAQRCRWEIQAQKAAARGQSNSPTASRWALCTRVTCGKARSRLPSLACVDFPSWKPRVPLSHGDSRSN